MAGKYRTRQESRALKARILELKKPGITDTEIARKLGVTRQYVSLVLIQAGIVKDRGRYGPKKTKENKTEVIAAIDRLERQGQKGLAEQLRMILDRSTGAKKMAG
jgi:predicted transcriptional regulator